MAISSVGGMSAGFQGLTGVQKPQVQATPAVGRDADGDNDGSAGGNKVAGAPAQANPVIPTGSPGALVNLKA